jgi:uncharacterized protein with HEPN domain
MRDRLTHDYFGVDLVLVWRRDRATLLLSVYRDGLLPSHEERAAFTAHTK